MNQTIAQRIAAQETWTFAECVGLADEFGMKVRMVVLLVLSQGKTYLEQDLNHPGGGPSRK